MAEFICTRKPRSTWISPWSSIQGTRNMIDALRLDQALLDLGPPVLGVAIDDDGDGVDHFADGLVELRLGRVPGLHQGYDLLGVVMQSRLPLFACLFPPPLIRRRSAP